MLKKPSFAVAGLAALMALAVLVLTAGAAVGTVGGSNAKQKKYTGTTSQDLPITLTVTGNKVEIEIQFKLSCPSGGPPTKIKAKLKKGKFSKKLKPSKDVSESISGKVKKKKASGKFAADFGEGCKTGKVTWTAKS